MGEQQVRRFLAELFSDLSAEAEHEMRHQEYIMEMPQSGERIRGREKMRQFQEAYPTPPTIQLSRVVVREGLWVIEGVNDYGAGQVFTIVLIIELRDGKMWRDTRYYAEPFEAPEWRAQLVERFEKASGNRFQDFLWEQHRTTRLSYLDSSTSSNGYTLLRASYVQVRWTP